ncbi:hypothetical protein AYO44_13105 [Planctomycetaceae bacterium SCGC AG-212-F19]|nr:hypothetical protein AYO44_13105 [Planctomycetaceae bacterium SCGC AG-212-F19]
MGQLTRQRKLCFSLLVVVFFLLLAEGAIRLNDLFHGASAHARGDFFWAFRQDRFLGYCARENVNLTMDNGNKIDTNAAGFRDVDIPIEPDVPRRLLICQGESSTWGTGCSDRYHTWPHLLQAELQRNCSEPFVVLNAGMPGYTTLENLQLLQLRLLKYKPEAIVYMGFRNDLVYYANTLTNAGDVNLYARQLAPLADTFVNRVLMHSSLGTIAVRAWGRRFPLDDHGVKLQPGARVASERGEALFRDQIALMKTICARHWVKLFWVDQPINPTLHAGFEKAYDEMRAILHDELRRQDIPLIAAHTCYDHAAVPMLDDVHYSDAGNQQLARIIAPQVLELLRGVPPQHTAPAASTGANASP